MSKLILDLNELSVESFSANDVAAAAQAPTTITLTVPVCCIEAHTGGGAVTFACDDYGVAAATHERICTTTR